jgi:hypothetical protein
MEKEITLNNRLTFIKALKNVFYTLLCCVKCVLGWVMWIIIFLLSLIFSFITWNWKETVGLDMENTITEICGKSTWGCMGMSRDNAT